MGNGVMDVVRFQSPAGGSVPVDQVISMGEDFTPKAILVFSVGTSGTFDADQSSDAFVCFGATDLTDAYSVCVVDKHSMPVSITGRSMRTALCSATATPTDNVYEDANILSVSPGSFTLQWGELSTTAFEYVAVVFGGSIQAKTMDVVTKTTTQQWSVTGVGFKPDMVIGCSHHQTNVLDHVAPQLRWSLGMATRDWTSLNSSSVKTQRCSATMSKNGQGSALSKRVMTSDSFYACQTTTGEDGEINEEIELNSFDSDGITLTTTIADGNARRFFLFFLKNVKATIEDILQPVTATSVSFSGMGFPARAGFTTTYGAADFDVVRDDSRISMGAWLQGSGSTSSGYGMAYTSEDGSDTTAIKLADGPDPFTLTQSDTDTQRAEMASIDRYGGRVDWGTVDGNPRVWPIMGILPHQATGKLRRPSKMGGLVA